MGFWFRRKVVRMSMTKADAWFILNHIRYKELEMFEPKPDYDHNIGTGLTYDLDVLRVMFMLPVTCIKTNKRVHVRMFKIVELNGMTENRLVDWVYRQCIELEKHETDEWFTYKGTQIHDPHAFELHHPSDGVTAYAIMDAEKSKAKKAMSFGELYGTGAKKLQELMPAPNYAQQARRSAQMFYANFAQVEEFLTLTKSKGSNND